MITWIVIIACLFLSIIVSIFFVWNVIAVISGAPYVPSSDVRIQSMIKLAAFSKHEVLLDVGSGNGKVLRQASKYVKIARGVEINPILVLWTLFRNWLGRYKNIIITKENFWDTNFGDIDVLFIYCINSKMKKLEQKIKKEMTQGSRVLSNGFILPTMHPKEEKNGVNLYVL